LPVLCADFRPQTSEFEKRPIRFRARVPAVKLE
jgi:hypothetical protein